MTLKQSVARYAAILAVAASLAACHSREKVVYLQDLQVDVPEVAANPTLIKVEPGDKITISVTSSDPELASIFNLVTVNRQNRRGGGGTATGGRISQTDNNASLYTVNTEGYIDFPVLGELHVAGLTRQQIVELIKQKLIQGKYVLDPVVTVEFANLHFTTIGDIGSRVNYIDDDRLNIIEAIAMAGDLNITGERDQVYVIRTEDGIRTTMRVDLRSKDLFNSPAYYIKQNDIIYVVPNSTRTSQSTINEHTYRSWSFWTGLFGLATSVAAFVIALTD